FLRVVARAQRARLLANAERTRCPLHDVSQRRIGAVLSQLLDLTGESNRRQKRLIGRSRFWRYAACSRVNRKNQIETTRNCHRSSDAGGPGRKNHLRAGVAELRS